MGLICFLLILLTGASTNADQITRQEYDRLRADFYLLDGLVQKIENSQIQVSRSFSTYQNSYRTTVNLLKPEASSKSELSGKLKTAGIVVFGDEHSNPQSQKNLVWILEQMALSGRTTLVIEWVEKRFQIYLNQYLSEKISEDEFKLKTQFDKTWGFSWESHVDILRAAKRLGVRIVAAENKTSEKSGLPVPLRTRDNNIVRSVAQIVESDPGTRILLAYGEAHLAGYGEDSHLREKLTRAGLAPDLTIFPWVGEEYWNILEKELDLKKTEVLKYSEKEYFLDQGTVLREWMTLSYYFSQLGLGVQHLNFVKSKLGSEMFQNSQKRVCRQLFLTAS